MAEVTLTLPQAMQQAVAAYERGELSKADRLLRAILGAKADHFDALHLTAIVKARQREFDLALASYDRALALRPDFAVALYNRGVTLQGLDRCEEALASYDRALAAQPDHVEALNNRGVMLQRLKRDEEALASYRRALALRPDFVEALNNLGNTLRQLKRYDEALASYDRVLAMRPGRTDALNNRGNTLQAMKRYEEALASYDRALTQRPDYAEALNNRGAALKELRRYDEALASHDRALALRPDYADAHINRGVTLRNLARFDEALASYGRALALRSDDALAHWNKSLLHLLAGDFTSGWREFEWRWKSERPELINRDFAQPLWLGGEPIDGRTVLLHCEQGFGDVIQFCRYVPLVAERGARVLFEVPEALQGLMASFAVVAEIVPAGGKLPHFDLHCPLLSLPLAFDTGLHSIPAHTPYLSAPPAEVRRWDAELGVKDRLRIGLVWSGRATHQNDAERSIRLRSLLRLLGVNAQFVSLQKDVRPDDKAVLQERSDLRNFGDRLETFSDTAALIANLDLVVSVDTSVAHLAGALGKPVWIMLPFVPDWRWLLDRQDSPWYPTARLFRQHGLGDWTDVLSRIVAELERLVREGTGDSGHAARTSRRAE